MSKKHCKVIGVYTTLGESDFYLRSVILITRQGKTSVLLDSYCNKHSYHYSRPTEMVKTCVNLARENGDYAVDTWTDFGAKWYDVLLVDGVTGSVGRWTYDD